MPGGIPQIAKMVDQLHSHGIKVMWPYNPCK
jgi:hypothetical protein